MKRILLIAKERDFRTKTKFCTEKSRSARADAVWCLLIASHSGGKEKRGKFYCRHSSIIIKQFKIHDFGTRIEFRRCKNVSAAGRSEKQKCSVKSWWEQDKGKKSIIENAKSLILLLSKQMSSSICFFLAAGPFTKAI